MKKSIILTFVCLCSVFAFSQTQSKSRTSTAKTKPKLAIYYSSTSIFYDKASCYYVAGKYTKDELSNTEFLASLASSTHVTFELGARCPDCSLEGYYKYLDSCPIVNTPYWQNLRDTLKSRIALQMEYDKLYNESQVNPEVLNNTPYASCIRYANVLANGTNAQIKDLWKESIARIASKNAYPDNIYTKYREQQASSDWKTFAKDDIQYIYLDDTNNIYSKIAEKSLIFGAEEKFKKLFVKINEPEM
ncbi:MAG: hypothetical protein ACK5MK_04290 [Dysgonomonas sp.]